LMGLAGVIIALYLYRNQFGFHTCRKKGAAQRAKCARCPEAMPAFQKSGTGKRGVTSMASEGRYVSHDGSVRLPCGEKLIA
jgi:hypothetical protein